MITELQGQVERITFTNEDNGYSIAKIKVPGRRDLVTVVGRIFAPTPGEILRMQGEWANHPQYGEQFKVTQYQAVVPATVNGIRKYLGSGLIKGIGPVMAGRMVKQFGEETLDVIEQDPDKLSEVEGIGPKRIDIIRRAWEEQREIRALMLFLQDHGVSSAFGAKIFKRYGNEAINVVRDNPYRLARDIFGIGFLTADGIAEKMGFAKDSAVRAEAGILHVLHRMSDEGHVYYPYEPLLDECVKILDIQDRSILAANLASLAADKMVVLEGLPRSGEDFQQNHEAVYLSGYHLAETGIALRLKTLCQGDPAFQPVDGQKAVEWVQERLSLNLARQQAEAVKRSVTDKVLVITGGPGTGKTTIVRAILSIFSRMRLRILLAAPTGRAAKRMSEATGREARTIHRLLEFNWQQGGFKKDEEHPLDCDLLVLDEVSMVDTTLMYHLLKAVPEQATLILVGDVDQLPSVGPGNVLRDVISSGAMPVVRLNEIFRQAGESSIIVNAHRINQGLMPSYRPQPGKIEGFFLYPADRARGRPPHHPRSGFRTYPQTIRPGSGQRRPGPDPDAPGPNRCGQPECRAPKAAQSPAGRRPPRRPSFPCPGQGHADPEQL